MVLPFGHPMRCAGCFEDLRETGVGMHQERCLEHRYRYLDGKWVLVYTEYEGDTNETRWYCRGCDCTLTDEQALAVRGLK